MSFVPPNPFTPPDPFAAATPPIHTPPPPVFPLPPGVGTVTASPAAEPDPEEGKSDADLVAEYIGLRDQQAVIKDRHTDELAPLKDRMIAIEKAVRARLDRNEVESVRTTKGTAFKTTQTRFAVDDPEALMAWVIENQKFELLARSVRPEAMKEYAEVHKALPPGVGVDSHIVVQFRKSK